MWSMNHTLTTATRERKDPFALLSAEGKVVRKGREDERRWNRKDFWKKIPGLARLNKLKDANAEGYRENEEGPRFLLRREEKQPPVKDEWQIV